MKNIYYRPLQGEVYSTVGSYCASSSACRSVKSVLPPGPAKSLLVIWYVPFCAVAIMSTHTEVYSASVGKMYICMIDRSL